MLFYCRRYKCKDSIFKVRADEYDSASLWGEFQCDCYWLDEVPFVEEESFTLD